MEVHLSKEEAWALVHQLLNNEVRDISPTSYWHFGKVEIKYLLDRIYGEDDEKGDNAERTTG